MTRHLLFFVFADFQLLDVSGPMAAFEMANRIAPGSYRWTVCSQTGGQVTASCGWRWTATTGGKPRGYLAGAGW